MASTIWRACCVALPLLCACGAPDAADRRALLATDRAQRLVGVWDVAFEADTTTMVFRMRHPARVVDGTIVLALNRGGPYTTSALAAVTHDGVYDIDFGPVGFTTRPSNGAAIAIAHLGRPVTDGKRAQGWDSLTIVLDPGSARFPVRMNGIFTGDAASGSWVAESYSAGGSQGRFTMRRHSPR